MSVSKCSYVIMRSFVNIRGASREGRRSQQVVSLNEQDALTDTAPPVISIAAAAFWQVAPLLLGKTGSRVRLGLQRSGTYLVVELERRPSTPAGALTAFMGNASQYLRIRLVQRGGNKGCKIASAREAQDCARDSTCERAHACV